MIAFPTRKRLATALLVPFFALAGLGSSGELLLCDMQGYTKACCCKHEASDSTTTAVNRPSCCTPVPTVDAPVQTADQRLPSQIAAPVVLVVSRIDAYVVPGRHVAFVPIIAVDDAPVSTQGPPLFIKHRALLI